MPIQVPWNNGLPIATGVGDETMNPATRTVFEWDGSSWKSPVFYVTSNQYAAAASGWAASHPIYTHPNDGSTAIINTANSGQPDVSVFTNAVGTSGTLNVEVAGSGVTIGSGVNQLGNTINLGNTGVTHGTQNGQTFAASCPTTITAGGTINLIFAGTQTNLTNSQVTIGLRKIL